MRVHQGDLNHTSTKLRVKAVEIIKNAKRPLSTHEIESHLRIHEPYMWCEISEKCSDYVRIILSLTRSDIVKKYKSKRQIRGIDKRATFFGLTSEQYSELDWIEVGDSIKKNTNIENNISISDQEKNNTSPIEKGNNSDTSEESISESINSIFENYEEDSWFSWYRNPINQSE